MKQLKPILPPIANETDAKLISACDEKVRLRRAIELGVVRNLITLLHEAGFTISADNGEEALLEIENVDEAIEMIFACDECSLGVRRKDSTANSFVYLVFGNDGWDTISDYGTSLEKVIDPYLDWLQEQASMA